MPEVKIYVGKLMFTEKWVVGIDFTTPTMNRSFGVELDSKCKQSAPYPGKILDLEGLKELHQLLESVINEWESNVE